MAIERIKAKLSDTFRVTYATILHKNDRTTKAIVAKGIATKGIGYKRFRQQKVSETKGVDFYSSLVW